MSNYSNTYGGAAKDAANDIILGAQIDTQLDAVATASATKLDEAGGTMTGVLDQNDTTDSTTGGTGSIHTDGGIGAVKEIVTDATFKPIGDTASGDLAAFGHTTADGAIITGQGATNDVVLKNDADAIALRVPTGTQDVLTPGTFQPEGDTAAGDAAAVGQTAADGLILTGQGDTNDVVLKNDTDTIVLRVPTGVNGFTATGTLTVDGAATITGAQTLTGVTTHGGAVVSDTDSTDDLGTTSVRWKELFVDTITITDFDSPRSVTKLKTGDQGIGTSTTLIDDTHMAGWVLDAASYYKIEGFIHPINAGSTGDFKQGWQLDNAAAAGGWGLGDHADGAEDDFTAFVTRDLAGTVPLGLTLTGFIRTHATLSSVLDFQWAQATSSAQNTVLQLGSWITITKMS